MISHSSDPDRCEILVQIQGVLGGKKGERSFLTLLQETKARGGERGRQAPLKILERRVGFRVGLPGGAAGGRHPTFYLVI